MGQASADDASSATFTDFLVMFATLRVLGRVHVRALRVLFDDLDVGSTGTVDLGGPGPDDGGFLGRGAEPLPFVRGARLMRAARDLKLLPRHADVGLTFPEFAVTVASGVATGWITKVGAELERREEREGGEGRDGGRE